MLLSLAAAHLLGRHLNLAAGLDIDYLDTRNDLVNAVTVEDASRVAKRLRSLGVDDCDANSSPREQPAL